VVMTRVIYINVKKLCILLIDCAFMFGRVLRIKSRYYPKNYEQVRPEEEMLFLGFQRKIRS